MGYRTVVVVICLRLRWSQNGVPRWGEGGFGVGGIVYMELAEFGIPSIAGVDGCIP